LINRAWGITFFWDGRASSLEEQVLQPIQDSSEMDLPIAQLVARLRVRADYRAAFASTFPDGVSAQNVARALASYVRTIRSGNSGLDRYETGDTSGLAPDARRGLTLFRGRANCTACHVGPNLTDERFHNTGVSTGTTDTGRYRVTGKDADRGAFKTPTLRDVARTRPYMHDGSLATLQDVVEFYDRGGRPSPALDAEIHRLGLSPPEKAELVAFLRSLSGTLTAAPPYGHR
jgi:cytochrome c peroxidase